MKNIIIPVIAAALILTGCRSSYPVAQQTGQEDIAYLLFVSQKEYAKKKLTIKIDETQFEAKAIKASKSKRKGTIYSIAPGSRHLIVQNEEGDVLYDKTIFISSQETKQIQLP